MALMPSTAPVVENAQHDPHCFWFLTGVASAAGDPVDLLGRGHVGVFPGGGVDGGAGARRAALYPSIFLNSSLVRSARWFKPTKWVCSPFSYSALCFWTNSWLSAKIFMRCSFSSSESYVLPCFCVHSWKRSLSDPTSFVAVSPSAALSSVNLGLGGVAQLLEQGRVSEFGRVAAPRSRLGGRRAAVNDRGEEEDHATGHRDFRFGNIAVVYPARSRAAGEVSRATRIETGGFGNTIRVCEVSRHPRWLCTCPGACMCGAWASSPGEVASDVDVDQIFPGDDPKRDAGDREAEPRASHRGARSKSLGEMAGRVRTLDFASSMSPSVRRLPGALLM